MQCTHPDNYYSNGVFNPGRWPCGKCLPCRLKDRREWAARLLLERKCHLDATFFTLTYDESNLPENGQLSKLDVQNWTKRFRYSSGQQPRYFICGEYGDKYHRPHYHGILFGREAQLERAVAKRSLGHSVIKLDKQIEETWQNGSTYVKACDLSTQGANITRYIANYILKKQWSDSESSNPEWSLQSRQPYIGQPSVKKLSDACATKSGSIHCGILQTIPAQFKMDGRYYPIPLRIRKEIADILGYPCTTVPYNDRTVIDVNGQKVLREKELPTQNFEQAKFAAKRISRFITKRHNLNPTLQTG